MFQYIYFLISRDSLSTYQNYLVYTFSVSILDKQDSRVFFLSLSQFASNKQ